MNMETSQKTSNKTQDHEIIKNWAEARNGKPALIETDGNSGGILKIRFDDDEQELKGISWNEFFDIFDRENLTFLYDPEEDNRFNKFIR